MKLRKSSMVIIAVLLIVTSCVIMLALINRSSELEGLPNYTDDKQKINVDGFKYENQPHIGDPNAKIKVIEFADFKCPACKKWSAENFEKFKSEFIDTGKVEFFYMNYAFIDRDSYLAAAAGEAIYQQNNEKFWEFYELLYQNQGNESEIWATPSFLIKLVKENITNIDLEQFEYDVRNHVYLHDVKVDYKTGGYYGVNGTPSFFVNGKILRSSSYEDLRKAILSESE
ncbi:thioredoxin domain-containing protein [Paenibacillus glucanolyticus]|uniref:thioredoxin domain-containing protein n=1 Tax=Paenibacillus TaxID=44249 RepID=UPI001E35F28A|nr:thioredoxin domain-containing protein [Paenibacillus glucanolyticus]